MTTCHNQKLYRQTCLRNSTYSCKQTASSITPTYQQHNRYIRFQPKLLPQHLLVSYWSRKCRINRHSKYMHTFGIQAMLQIQLLCLLRRHNTSINIRSKPGTVRTDKVSYYRKKRNLQPQLPYPTTCNKVQHPMD